VLRVSASIGSEAGVLSIGSGSGIDHIAITAAYVNRFERSESIWDIERKIRKSIQEIPNIKYFSVFDYGATALSSIRGNVDVKLSSDSFEKLQIASEKLFKVLENTKGLVNVAKTWDLDKTVYRLFIDEAKAAYYGVNSEDISKQVGLYLKGTPAALKPVKNSNDIMIRIRGNDRDKVLLLMDYHTSMPAMMGFILLSGIIVNNAILLIEFALLGMKNGLEAKEAMLESIKIRTRPVLMTAFATTAGMLPVALGWAIGLERLAPLGAVAIGGLMVGTFLTLVFIPILFVWIYKNKKVVEF